MGDPDALLISTATLAIDRSAENWPDREGVRFPWKGRIVMVGFSAGRGAIPSRGQTYAKILLRRTPTWPSIILFEDYVWEGTEPAPPMDIPVSREYSVHFRTWNSLAAVQLDAIIMGEKE